ncbi:MAG: hypothetical protein Marn2KO_22770 [Marinobacter nauticus]
MSSDQGIYIRALKFGASKETFTIQQLTENLGLTEQQEFRLVVQLSNKEIFFHNRSNYIREFREGKEVELSLSVEDEFRLLEYTELKEARKASRQATYFATAALIVSVIATISSIGFSYKSSISDIKIPTEIEQKIAGIEENAELMVKALSELSDQNASTQRTLNDMEKNTGLIMDLLKDNGASNEIIREKLTRLETLTEATVDEPTQNTTSNK